MIETDRNGEFRPQAQRFAVLAFGEEDAAAQILARHVEKGIGRLHDGDVGQFRAAFGEEGDDIGGEGGSADHAKRT